ncbi:reverse transcriptase domain-containing protein [Tanacetum coccineum]
MAPTTRRGPNTPVNNTNPNNMTPESIQAMIDQALLRNSTNGDGSHSSHGDNRRNVQTARPCFYADFMKCQPLNFKGTEGVVGLTRWIEKMESVFNISGCAIENQVKFATCTLLGAALTWWNGQIRTLGPEAYAMTWEVLKKKMTDKYCPQGEIKKLEIELWNLKVKGNDVPAYTERFQELTLICTKFVANETEKVDKYISGLPDNIYGNVKSARPKTLDETIELANDLMDQKLRTYAERQSDNKRKADDSSRNNHGHQQQPFKRQNVAKVYNMGTGERKPYGGSLPKCTKCHLHHNGPCTQRCHKCNKIGHFARDCRNTGNTNVANTQKGNGAAPKGNGCFECGAPGHFKRDCPKLKNKDGGNGNAQGWVYAVGNAEKRGNAPGNPDAFLNITSPTSLENCYDVELADGKLVEIDTIIRAQEYHGQRMPGFLAQISVKRGETESEEKQIKGRVQSSRDFPEVFTRTARFIEGFSKIAKSMTKLTQKGIKFDWGEKEENAFQLIKQKLMQLPQFWLSLPEGARLVVLLLMPFTQGHSTLPPHFRESKRSGRCAGSRIKKRIKPFARVSALSMTIGLDLPKRILKLRIVMPRNRESRE